MNNVDGKVIIDTSLNTKKFEKQIEKTEEELKHLEHLYDSALKSKGQFKESEEAIRNLGVEIEKTANKLSHLKDSDLKQFSNSIKNIEFNPQTISNIEQFNLSTNQLGNSFKNINGELPYIAKNMRDLTIEEEKVEKQHKKTKNVIDKGFNKGIKSLNKFALSLLKIGTIYGLVSKASSAYLSNNEATANKLKSVWTFLGEIVGPVIEFISDSILRLIGYINEFIKAFTDGKVDIVARANAKAIDKQTASQTKLNKATQQYDFDVVRTQQSNSTGEGISGSGVNGLIEIPELNQDLVKKLQDLAGCLKENKTLIEGVGIALGVTFGAIAIGKILSNIGSLIGVGGSAGAGLSALAWILGTIATVWLGYVTIKGVKEAIEQTKQLNKQLDENLKMHEEQAKSIPETAKNMVEWANSEKEVGEKTKQTIDYLKRQISITKNQQKSIEGQLIPAWLDWTGANKKTRKEMELSVEEMDGLNTQLWELYKQGKLTDEEIQFLAQSLYDQGIKSEELGLKTNDLKDKLQEINKNYNPTIELSGADKVKSDLTNILNLTQDLIDKKIHISSSSRMHSGGGRAFAHGGIVTQPTRALIGEAGYNEYVLPEREDYLSRLASLIGQYGNNNSGITNVYLDGRLIQRQVDSKQKQVNFARNS